MLDKEYKEQYKAELEKMSFEKLVELARVLKNRLSFIESCGVPDDGTKETLSMVEKAIERADINERVAKILHRA